MHKKHWSTVLKVLSSLLILYLLYLNIDFSSEEFIQTWKKIDIFWLIMVLPVVAVVLGIKSYRWRSIILSGGDHYHWKKSLKAYLAAYSIGVVTPGRLGELLKVYNLKKDVREIDGVKAFQTVVLDRLFDMFFLGWFGIAGVLFYLSPFGEIASTIALLIAFLAVIISLFVGKAILVWIAGKHFKGQKFFGFLMGCVEGMTSKSSIYPWLYSAVAYAVYFAGIQFLFFALDISINFIETGFMISLIGLILLLPISIAGFGTREAGLIYLLSMYGIAAETALSFSFLQFLAFFVWGGIIGLFFWMASPVSIHTIRKDSEKLLAKIRVTAKKS